MTTVEYESSDPSSLQDINIREYGHLTRINDEAAAYFYALYSNINTLFAKRKVITRKTPSLALKNALEDNSLLTLLGAAVNGASTEMLKGRYDSDCLKLISLDSLYSHSYEGYVLIFLEWVLIVNFSYAPPLLSLLCYHKC